MASGNYEIKLYFGLVSDYICLGEGDFNNNPISSYEKERYARAFECIRRYFDWHNGEPNFGFDCFLRSEIQAKKLIEFCEKNIPRSRGLIELVDSVHGMVGFHRKILFECYNTSEKKFLIETLSKSGIELDGYLLNKRRGLYYGCGNEAQTEKQIKKMNPKEPWTFALKRIKNK